jgi:hypothetical protein
MSIRKTSQLHQLETENDGLQKAVVELKREPSRTRQSSRKSASALKQASVWMSADEGSECEKAVQVSRPGNANRRLGVEIMNMPNGELKDEQNKIRIYGKFKTGAQSEPLTVKEMTGPDNYTWSEYSLGRPSNDHVDLTAKLAKNDSKLSGGVGDLNITIQFGNVGPGADSVLKMSLGGFMYP